ncbi:tripartite tricarboxylate transporter substrate binding protein [Rhodoplanes sp. TEM]|uniref:Tripartite tricarboxylate transporter substrate binding protein n=1 Tax=Rhodoplanes tepidamans TaxID=200616 RepID=A0ABT5JCN0_RHOTP|nr:MULTISPECIES: tripartite tricarboxylate transporter substrate binding protein [Rhodoplanes]MDC7787116.1 tripartite tricarboxylate transporter substrate binding protein [Rhodoplanes tepidamans]MDC7986820.1 tripartite tricarboxylate transporter substrate binding protein [Rhodoplanes sp. TEM]MDQ0358717.1 tripartite-type tricarboxylate transporter receptor subunit TctC [Rhodoplanes tepidamans]
MSTVFRFPLRARRAALAAALVVPVAAALAAVSSPAAAQADAAKDWPARNVRVMVPFAAGGPADLVAREVAARMGEDLGRAFIIENQGGAGGKLAVLNVARAEPDGYTLLFPASGNVVSHPLAERDMSTVEQLVPIGLVSTSAHVLVIDPKLPIRTMADLVAYAKANPGKLHFGSAGTGAVAHLGMEMLKMTAGIDIVHVPYRGTSQAIVDVMSGQIQATFSSMPSLRGMIDQGTLRALGMTAKSRGDAGLPLISDTVPAFGYTTWYGLFAPKGTPPAIIDRISASLKKALSDKALQEKLAVQGMDLEWSTPAALDALMKQDIAKWSKVIEAANIRLK